MAGRWNGGDGVLLGRERIREFKYTRMIGE
jgi:hypothetical protein